MSIIIYLLILFLVFAIGVLGGAEYGREDERKRQQEEKNNGSR